MARNYDGIDFLWDGTNGDYALSQQGDIQSTEFDPLMAIAQDMYSRVKSEKDDWKEAPMIGAGLADYVGEPNIQDTGNQIKKRLMSAMQAYGAIDLADLYIDVIPVAKDIVAIVTKLNVMPTARNKSSRVIKRTYFYSFVENNVFART
jgi:hypothetical protein